MALPADPLASQTFHLLTTAAPSRVWSALTCPRTSPRYLHGLTLSSSWQSATPLLFGVPGLPPSRGQVLFVQPPVVLSYALDDGSGATTYVSWRIRQVERGCVIHLHVHETDTTGEADLEEAWLPVVDALRLVLATEDQPTS